MRLKEGQNGQTYIVEKISIELNLERRLDLRRAQGSPCSTMIKKAP